MRKLILLLFIVCVSCGKAPKTPQWSNEIESQSLSPYQDIDKRPLTALKCVAEKDYQIFDQFEWIMPVKLQIIKILNEGQIEILFRKAKKKDFSDNTLAATRNFKSAVLYEGIPTEIHSLDEKIYCTFYNPWSSISSIL